MQAAPGLTASADSAGVAGVSLGGSQHVDAEASMDCDRAGSPFETHQSPSSAAEQEEDEGEAEVGTTGSTGTEDRGTYQGRGTGSVY
jgi:hypothetical protein